MALKVLVVDVGGNNVKLLASGRRDARKVPSGPRLTPSRMVTAVRWATEDWGYDAVAIGYPGQVRDGRIAAEPMNLGRGWTRYDFRRGFRRPVRIINDAVMQALGSYRGGRLLFLGLGTGLGAALVLEGLPQPLEIAHLPYRGGKTYEDFLGKRGFDRAGRKRWRRLVFEIVPRLQAAFQVDEVVLGGGNAKQLRRLPRGCRRGDNRNAFLGGFRLFRDRGQDRRGERVRRRSAARTRGEARRRRR
jgi:predicted NBD/HSP70 family sugar kinase